MVVSCFIVLGVILLIFAVFAGKDLWIAKKRGTRYNWKSCAAAGGMLLPAFVLTFLFVLLPIVYSLGYAFTDYKMLPANNMSMNFVGFDNFERFFKEVASKGDAYSAIKNTLTFVVLVVPLQIGMALGLALFVNRRKFAVGAFKIAFFAPVVISLSITSELWMQILDASETGLINSFLGGFGVAPQDFMHDPDQAMIWIVVISAWQGCGYQMLIFLSGLTNIRKELYEAAALDGAGAFQQFLHITCPGLRSTFVYVLVTVSIGAFRIMVQPMLMTRYQTHTVTLSYYMYQWGVKYFFVGYSSAVALLMTIVIGGITYLQRRFLREKD